MSHDPEITMKASELDKLRHEAGEEARELRWDVEQLEEKVERLQDALSETGDAKVDYLLEKAVDLLNDEAASSHYCVAIAGLENTRSKFLGAVKSLIGVEMGRATDYGHISFCVRRWKETRYE